MSTKFYLTNVAAGYSPATFKGTWDDTTAAITKALDGTKDNNGQITSVAKAEISATNPFAVLLYRGVSGPLAAGSISGADTLNVLIGVIENTATADFNWKIHAYITQGDSDSVRGTVLSNYTESAGTNEWGTSSATGGKQLNSAQTTSAVTITAGDRLVIEVGYVARNTVTTSFTGTLWYGTQDSSNNILSDLTNGGSATTLAGFITLSSALSTGSVSTRLTQEVFEVLVSPTSSLARLTQEVIEVAIQPSTTAARLTQQVIEILRSSSDAPIVTVSLSQSLTISQTLTEVKVSTRSIPQTLTLTPTIINNEVFSRSISDSLTISQTLTEVKVSTRSIPQSLSLTDSITDNEVFSRSISDNLTLTSTIANNELYNLLISQILTLTPAIINNEVYDRTISQALSIFDTISITTRVGTLDQTLVLSQTITENQGFAESLSQNLTLSQTIIENQGYAESLNQNLTLSQTITENQGYAELLSQNLTLNQTISYILNHTYEESVDHTLDLDQFVDGFTDNLRQHITQNLIFNNVLVKPLDIHSIVTNINGHTISIPTVLAIVIPTNKPCSVVLSVPDLSIVLPCPLFGDTQANISSLNHKRTMTGNTYAYIKNSTLNKLSYRFELPRIKKMELLNFLKLNMSKPIIMHNWKGEVWYSYITNNPMDMITKGLWNHPTCPTEYNEVVLDFEGNKL